MGFIISGSIGGGGGNASSITFAPTGNIASTNVQSAIAEIDSESLHITGNESIAGIKTFTDTTDSSSITTGGLVITGGLGIGKSIKAGVTASSHTFNGSCTLGSSSSNTQSLQGNTITIGSGSASSVTINGNPIIGSGSASTPTINGNATLGSSSSNNTTFNGRITVGNFSASSPATHTFNGLISSHIATTPIQNLSPTGTTQTINWNNGSFVILNLGSGSGDVTLTLNNPPTTPTIFVMLVKQGSTPRNLIFPAGTTQSGGGGVTYVGNTANSTVSLAVTWDGTNYFVNASPVYS